MDKAQVVKLKNRGVIKITGPDRRSLLQNIVTNDITLLDQQDCVYTCLLSPQGKFLFDFFVTEQDNTLFLDCEGGERAESLFKRLSMYKLRSDVTLDLDADANVYALLTGQGGYDDPRHPDMGRRCLFEAPDGAEETPYAEWDERRIRLCIPDGSRDMEPDKSTLLECHIDKLNGVSFEKGCYVGQELTARMHYRGLAKKHLYVVEGDNLPESGETISADGKMIGEMRSRCGTLGLALLKDESVSTIPAGMFQASNPTA